MAIKMKNAVLRSILAGAALAALATAPAHAAWKEYTYKDLGIIKDFPVEPKMEKGIYKTPLAKEAPKVVYSVVIDGVTYQMTAVDFATRIADGGNLMGEAAALATAGRDTTFTVDDFPLYDKGTNSVYGLNLRIEKANGDHVSSMIFFNKGHLFLIEALVPKGAAGTGSANIGRFMETEIFHLAGYGFDFNTGHDYPIGDDDPNNRDTHVNPNYKPPAGYENVGKIPAPQ